MVAGELPSPEEVARKAERKLAAILHADVVGFSRLMNEDEVGTHEQLMAHRKVFYELISERNGRIVGTAGDAILADFSSVVDALSAAVNVQEALSERNSTIPLERKLEFRIGINLGDVIVDGEDIFGDGVNVAARLEALADPGGIAVSGAVYDQVKTKMNLDFDPRGRHRVKNIKESVRVYAIVSKGSVISHKQIEKNRQVIVYAAAAILCMLAVVAVFLPWKSLFSPDERSDAPITSNEPVATLALNGKPTIAVLPFRNRGNEEAQAYFSDGITEDVITDLGRFSNLLVLSWNAVAPYRGTTVSLDQLSRDLNVRYVVGGTVHRAGLGLPFN